MRYLLLVLILATGSAGASGVSMTTLWKARALDALERLEKLPPSQPYSPERYRANLEEAFSHHANASLPVHKTFDDMEAFHLILNGGGDTGLFDLVYIYKLDGTLIGTRVESLPKGWTIVMLRDTATQLVEVMEHRRTERGIVLDDPPLPLVVGTAHAMLVFDLNDPFNPFVMELAMDSPAKDRGTDQPAKPRKAAVPPKKPASVKATDL
jgi:hypothetical protein